MNSAKVLVVDDEKDLREALRISLKSAGFVVTTAQDGKEGLERALEEKPDIVLLDIIMPEMTGHQMLSKLRRDSWGKDVPVLLLTNTDDPADVVQGVEFKSNDYIIKAHTSLEDIVKKVKQQLAGYG